MGWQDTLQTMASMRQAFIKSDLGQTLGQEWDNARLTLAATFDTRLRTMEILYSRDMAVHNAIHYESPAPLGPSPQPEPGPNLEPDR